MKTKPIPTDIKERLHYDPSTGVFTWIKENKSHPRLTGQRAGATRNGYEMIKLDGNAFRSHRLAWFYMTGNQPEIIDHINGDGLDNRFDNLRNTTQAINAQNHKERVKENNLPTGVSTCGSKFRARITVNKKVIFLGSFDTPEKAYSAYRDARDKYHDAPAARN